MHKTLQNKGFRACQKKRRPIPNTVILETSKTIGETSKSREKASAVGSIRQLRSSIGAWIVHKKTL